MLYLLLLVSAALCQVIGFKHNLTKPNLLFVEHSVNQDMEQVNWDYSTKNIPIPSDKEYRQALIQKTSEFMKRAVWKAYFVLNPTETPVRKETFGFKSSANLPFVPELKEMEESMLELIQSIENKQNYTTPNFQKHMAKDIQKIKQTNDLLVKADKTNNYYKLNKDDHNKLIQENIQKEYKKATKAQEENITAQDKKVASKLELADRIHISAKTEAFVTLKDHKENFSQNPKVRLINPNKSQLGKISKSKLDKINRTVREKTKSNQWRSTKDVISWFKNIENKPKNNFIQCDIDNFYPSITETLLNKALDYASQFCEISDEDRKIIILAKNTLLYNSSKAWTKRGNKGHFDVTMGSYDGSETCELVGLYILSLIEHLEINVGLYRDDCLATSTKTPRQIEIIKKKMCKIFKDLDLKITIEANAKSQCVNFLDIQLDLKTGIYKPFNKPNNIPQYVHTHSNHPPTIIKNIPEGINKRLTTNSVNEEVFNETSKLNQEALTKAGHKYKLHHNPETNNNSQHKHSRKRNIIWFNPPYSQKVSTQVGKKFLQIIDKCFPKGHTLHKAFNRNTVKVSYSTTANFGQIISRHNKQILNTATEELCKCEPGVCPLDSKCKTQDLVYQATVTQIDNNKVDTYIGLTSQTFRKRYNQHNSDFRNPKSQNATTLSTHIWKLKAENIRYEVKWKFITRAKSFSPAAGTCNLCNAEKYFIICKPEMASLNKRNEILSKCRHRRKFLLTQN